MWYPRVVSLTHVTIISQWETGIHLQVLGKFIQTNKVSLGQPPSVVRGRTLYILKEMWVSCQMPRTVNYG